MHELGIADVLNFSFVILRYYY